MNKDNQKRKEMQNIEIAGFRMHVKSVAHKTILAWRISDYEKLQCNIMYFEVNVKENIKCIFRLFKFNKTLHLSLSSADVLRDTPAEFSILNEASFESITEQAVKIKDGVFVGQFPEDKFLNESISFLTGGILTVTFKYAADFCKTIRNSNLMEPEILTNWDDLCYDFKSMYLDSLFPDFNIHVKEYTFKSHKVVLTARSRYFLDILESDKEKLDHKLPDDTMLGILHQVLLYMYCGELMEWNNDFVLQVYKLAVFLEVSTLCRRCIQYFEKEINEDNYMKLCEFASEFQLKELKNMIIRSSLGEFKHLDIVGVFKKIDKQSKEKKVVSLEGKGIPQK